MTNTKKVNFIPKQCVVKDIFDEAKDVKTIRLAFCDKVDSKEFSFLPGQFVEASILGVGEAPISISSSPFEKKYFDLTVKKMGSVSSSLFSMEKGDVVGIRGPYGKGYPMNELVGKNIIFVGGGFGLPSLKSAIEFVLRKRNDFEKLTLLYGACTPEDLVFKKQLKLWAKEKNFEVRLTVDNPTCKWTGNTGVVTTLFNKANIEQKNNTALVCGPPIMMKFVQQSLESIKLSQDDIFLSLEKLMKCGVGKCGHCNTGEKYVCIDGPVFSARENNEISLNGRR